MKTLTQCNAAAHVAAQILPPPPPPQKLSKRFIRGMLALGIAGLAGMNHAVCAQTLTLTAELTAQGVALTAMRDGYTHPADGTNAVQIDRCAIPDGMNTCSLAPGPGRVSPVSGQPGEHPGATFTDPFDSSFPPEPGATYIYRWSDIAAADTDSDGSDDNVVATVQITVAVSGGDAAANDAILPNVLRNITEGIHGGVYDRIQQRQRADGKWK